MNYLFIHQNFPAQYRHVVRYLADQPGNRVYFITQPNDNAMAGVYKIAYPKDPRGPVNCHAYAVEIDRAIYAGANVAEVCRGLREQGFRPDLIVGHAGWGDTVRQGCLSRRAAAGQFRILLSRPGRGCGF
jgi:hypothetical protein